MQVFDNKSGPTSVRNAFNIHTSEPGHLLFASPFFTYTDLVIEILKGGSSIKLIVVLNEITSPDALNKLLSYSNIQIRFFTTSKFHSKLYIFGNKYALIGSSNLTASGLQSNQEICIGVEASDDETFDDLVSLYQSYWEEAEPISAEIINKFDRIQKANIDPNRNSLKSRIKDEIGVVEPTGLQVGGKKKSTEKIYLEQYKRTYQEYFSAFKIVEKEYLKFGLRKVTEEVLPLRLEIDQFFNYMRQEHAISDSYKDQPHLLAGELEKRVSLYIAQWHASDMPFIFDSTVPAYKKISTKLASRDHVMSSNAGDLFDALLNCYSFHDRLRFYKGGTEGHRKAFIQENTEEDIQKTITYLLFNTEIAPIERMADCIFNEELKLRGFAKSCVQELLGWVNGEDIPVFNDRTGKVLRYLGFEITGY
jgi:hypothetical protein